MSGGFILLFLKSMPPTITDTTIPEMDPRHMSVKCGGVQRVCLPGKSQYFSDCPLRLIIPRVHGGTSGFRNHVEASSLVDADDKPPIFGQT